MYSEKILSLEKSKTLEITKIVNEYKNSGINAISFAAGEPDFDTPEFIKDEAIKAMKNGFTKYTEVSGIKALKKEIAKKLKVDNNLSYNEDEIIVSNGAKQSLSTLFVAILNPLDEVLIPKPYWTSYPEMVKIAGGVSVFVEGVKENSYKIDINDLKNKISDKTKAIIINSPCNPTGVVYTKEELLEIAEICTKNNILIVSDEIYEKLIYDNKLHYSVASLSEEIFKNTIVINGFSKSYAMTGWRVGYAAGNKEIITLMNKVQGHMTSNVNTIAQYAALGALNADGSELLKMKEAFQKRKDLMVSLLKKIEGISFIVPEGAFYVMVNIKNVYNSKVNNSEEFAKKLLEEYKVAVIPGSAFGDDDFIRLSFATNEENIMSGINKIENFIKNSL